MFRIALGLLLSVLLGCGEATAPEASSDLEGTAPEAAPAPVEPVEPRATAEAPYSGNAQPEIVRELRADRAAGRSQADLGGRAFAMAREDGSPPTAQAGGRGRFHFAYEAGPLGVAVGGSVQLQVSPFWGWSDPQVTEIEAAGFTQVTTPAEGVDLRPDARGRGLLVVEIAGRALAEGERIDFVYGAGSKGARVDRYAEERSPFLFAVDGDGDGKRGFLAGSPTVARAGRASVGTDRHASERCPGGRERGAARRRARRGRQHRRRLRWRARAGGCAGIRPRPAGPGARERRRRARRADARGVRGGARGAGGARPRRPRGHHQPDDRGRGPPPDPLGRSPWPLRAFRRDRHARRLLSLRPRGFGPRCGRAHRPRPLGHSVPGRVTGAVARDPRDHGRPPRTRPLRHDPGLRVDELAVRPPPRPALRRRGRRRGTSLQLVRRGHRHAGGALGGAARRAGAHLRAPLRGCAHRHQLGDRARPGARAPHRGRIGAWQQRVAPTCRTP